MKETVSDEACEVQVILILYCIPVILTLSVVKSRPSPKEGREMEVILQHTSSFGRINPLHDATIMTHRPVEWNPGLTQ